MKVVGGVSPVINVVASTRIWLADLLMREHFDDSLWNFEVPHSETNAPWLANLVNPLLIGARAKFNYKQQCCSNTLFPA